MVILEHLGHHFHVQNTLVSGGAAFWGCMGHLGIPGWSGVGFREILGYLWTSPWRFISKIFVKQLILGGFFFELLSFFSWGGFLDAFASMF